MNSRVLQRGLILLLCFAGGASLAGVGTAASALPPTAGEKLRTEAAATLGASRFACLVAVHDPAREAEPVRYILRITTRRALVRARRFRRTHPGIRAIQLVAPRYSLASMRRLEGVVRSALAGYPDATVRPPSALGQAAGPPRAEPCPPIMINVGDMPRPAGPSPHPGQEPPETLAAVQPLRARYGDRLIVAVAR
jgi:hypothetical protein